MTLTWPSARGKVSWHAEILDQVVPSSTDRRHLQSAFGTPSAEQSGDSMSTSGDQDGSGPITRMGQIIVGALVAGVSIFLVIAVMLDLDINPGGAVPVGAGGGAGAPGAGQPGTSMPILTYAALAFAAISLPMSVIVPGLVTRQRRSHDCQREVCAPDAGTAVTQGPGRDAPVSPVNAWRLAYLNQLIIGAAINEGATFFAAIAYLIEKNPIALVLAAVLIAGLIARFPTVDRVEHGLNVNKRKSAKRNFRHQPRPTIQRRRTGRNRAGVYPLLNVSPMARTLLPGSEGNSLNRPIEKRETATMKSHATTEPASMPAHIAFDLNDDRYPQVVIVEFLSRAIADPGHAAELSQQLGTLIRPELPRQYVLDFEDVRSLSSTAFGASLLSHSRSARGAGTWRSATWTNLSDSELI